MGYGTLEYEIMSKTSSKKDINKNGNFKRNKFYNKKKFWAKSKEDEVVKVESEENCMVMYPQLPDNWVKKTETGEPSYDETVREINRQLKRTIVNKIVYLNELK